MKKLFTNYNFEFDKNEKKILKTFCNQTLKQIEGDSKYFSEIRVFKSLLDKLNGNDEVIKLTKEERTKLKFNLVENIKHLQKVISKSWFIKKWFYKTILIQYENLIDKHFED
jgi:hypothetical protein